MSAREAADLAQERTRDAMVAYHALRHSSLHATTSEERAVADAQIDAMHMARPGDAERAQVLAAGRCGCGWRSPAKHVLSEAELDANMWASCGPASVAALLGRPLAEIRHAFPNQHEGRTWANLAQMATALRALGTPGTMTPWHGQPTVPSSPRSWPTRGLVLIQFNGSWDKLPVSHPAQLAHSHWIAVDHREDVMMPTVAAQQSRDLLVHSIGGTRDETPWVFDVNATSYTVLQRLGGWMPRRFWEGVIAPEIAASYGKKRDGSPRAPGGWWVRSGIEVAS